MFPASCVEVKRAIPTDVYVDVEEVRRSTAGDSGDAAAAPAAAAVVAPAEPKMPTVGQIVTCVQDFEAQEDDELNLV